MRGIYLLARTVNTPTFKWRNTKYFPYVRPGLQMSVVHCTAKERQLTNETVSIFRSGNSFWNKTKNKISAIALFDAQIQCSIHHFSSLSFFSLLFCQVRVFLRFFSNLFRLSKRIFFSPYKSSTEFKWRLMWISWIDKCRMVC